MTILHSSWTKEGSSLACAQAGCRECLEELLRQHKGLVYVVVRRQYPGKCDYADLIQEGWIGLWQAIEGYDAERGSAFSTYAGMAIRNRVWQAVEREWKEHGWQEVEKDADRLSEVIGAWQREQEREALAEEMACLPERIRWVIERAYGLEGGAGETLKAIGKEMGVSGEWVRRLRNDGLVLMRLPAMSVRLRGLCERDRREDYRKAEQLNREWMRQKRGKR